MTEIALYLAIVLACIGYLLLWRRIERAHNEIDRALRGMLKDLEQFNRTGLRLTQEEQATAQRL